MKYWQHEIIQRIIKLGVKLIIHSQTSVVQLLKCFGIYRQVSNIRRTKVGNNIVDNSDVVGASPVGAAHCR